MILATSARARVYLDYNASAPLRPVARAAMEATLDLQGNASSVHGEGRAVRAVIEDARRQIAALLGAEPKNLIFVSGATEAANLALTPFLRDKTGGCEVLLAGAGEHPCVLSGHGFASERFFEAPLGPQGVIDLAALERLLAAAPGRPMLALQAANNETGAIQPMRLAADIVHARNGIVVCDAVQWAGRGPCDLKALGADALLISSHKLGGPKGAGALALADGLYFERGLIRGGGQERGARGGTENALAIAGFAAAAREAFVTCNRQSLELADMRDRMEATLQAGLPDIEIFSANTARLPNTSAFAVPGLAAETLLMALDLGGIAVSSGSACSSGKVRPSHVLASMGVQDHISRCALRISLGWASQPGDIDRFCETFQRTVSRMLARRTHPVAGI